MYNNRYNVWPKYYCNVEEANGKMFRQIGDISPSKFIHSSPTMKKRMATLIHPQLIAYTAQSQVASENKNKNKQK